MSPPSKSRVAAYVREPDALALREEEAKQQAIVAATPFLQHEGWSELEFQGAEWDDDPQSGRAFYIYFRGVPPEGRSGVEQVGVQCIRFTPPQVDGAGTRIRGIARFLGRMVAGRR